MVMDFDLLVWIKISSIAEIVHYTHLLLEKPLIVEAMNFEPVLNTNVFKVS
jgi:hypothetical protein